MYHLSRPFGTLFGTCFRMILDPNCCCCRCIVPKWHSKWFEIDANDDLGKNVKIWFSLKRKTTFWRFREDPKCFQNDFQNGSVGTNLIGKTDFRSHFGNESPPSRLPDLIFHDFWSLRDLCFMIFGVLLVWFRTVCHMFFLYFCCSYVLHMIPSTNAESWEGRLNLVSFLH